MRFDLPKAPKSNAQQHRNNHYPDRSKPTGRVTRAISRPPITRKTPGITCPSKLPMAMQAQPRRSGNVQTGSWPERHGFVRTCQARWVYFPVVLSCSKRSTPTGSSACSGTSAQRRVWWVQAASICRAVRTFGTLAQRRRCSRRIDRAVINDPARGSIPARHQVVLHK